jgi:hypothetical protein
MEDTISSVEAAKWFGMTRPTFYKFAEDRGIGMVGEDHNPARHRQLRRYNRQDAIRVYRELYHRDPPQSTNE